MADAHSFGFPKILAPFMGKCTRKNSLCVGIGQGIYIRHIRLHRGGASGSGCNWCCTFRYIQGCIHYKIHGLKIGLHPREIFHILTCSWSVFGLLQHWGGFILYVPALVRRLVEIHILWNVALVIIYLILAVIDDQ